MTEVSPPTAGGPTDRPVASPARMSPPADQRGDATPGGGPGPGGHVHAVTTSRRAKRGVVAVLVAALIVSGLAREWARALQQRAYEGGPYAPVAGSGGTTGDATFASTGGPTLGSLDSYFLVLLLGGLRGPLVMFLWSSSENQKIERDLEDFDTKIELIRLLQPEFDSVHLFQAWNKGYNVSVQIPNLANKYAVILDAVRYLEKVDQSRPNNLNILLALSQMYQHKLGSTVGDNVYYRRQVREDSKWRDVGPQGVGALQQRMAPILEKDGSVAARLAEPRTARPTDLKARIVLTVTELAALKAQAARAGVALPAEQLDVPAGVREMAVTLPEAEARKLEPFLADRVDVRFVYADWNDGSEMQYLVRYGPYPYGVSPLALGYNYLKRGQVLINRTGQRPSQGSRAVVDSRTGNDLRGWMDEEWGRALAAEARLFGITKIPPERQNRLATTAGIPLSAKPADNAADLEEAFYSFRMAHRLARDARAEYTRHLTNPAEGIRRVTDYTSHLDNLAADELMTAGDLAYLSAIVGTTPDRRDALLAEAADRYAHARARYQQLNLRYYVPGEAKEKLLPGVTADELEEWGRDPVKMDAAHQAFMTAMPQFAGSDQTTSERLENLLPIDRATQRLAQVLVAQGKAPPATAPAAMAPAATQPATAPATQPTPTP